jgi:hypothetical protein
VSFFQRTTNHETARGFLAVVRRRFLLVLVCAIAAAAALSFAAGGKTTAYTATGYFVIPSGGTTGRDAAEASRSAQNYASALALDTRFIASVAGSAGINPDHVTDNMRLGALPDSAVLAVTYTAQSRQEVSTFFAAFNQVAGASPAATPTIVPGSLQELQLPTTATPQGNLGTMALPLGAILGLALGVAVSILLERAHPRLDTVEDLRLVTPTPTIDLRTLSLPGAEALFENWKLQADSADASVVIAGLRGSSDWSVPLVTTALDAAQSTSAAPDGGRVRLIAGRSLGADGEAERLAQQADVSVLAVPVGAPLSTVQEGLDSLARFGKTASWILLVPKRHRAKHSQHAAAAAGDSSRWRSQSAIDRP